MAKVTWLGQGEHGPKQLTQWGVVFTKDEALEVSDADIYTRAEGDNFFKVERDEKEKNTGKKPEVKAEPKVEPKVEVKAKEEPKAGPTVSKPGDPPLRPHMGPKR
jgi:hypothetical protein